MIWMGQRNATLRPSEVFGRIARFEMADNGGCLDPLAVGHPRRYQLYDGCVKSIWMFYSYNLVFLFFMNNITAAANRFYMTWALTRGLIKSRYICRLLRFIAWITIGDLSF